MPWIRGHVWIWYLSDSVDISMFTMLSHSLLIKLNTGVLGLYAIFSVCHSYSSFCRLFMLLSQITACAVATSCWISDVPSQWEGRNFDPPQLPHFSTDLNETWNKARYPGYDPTCKIWLMWDDGKEVCVGRAFSVTFCVSSFLYSCPRLQVTPEDRSRPFMAQNACFP